MLFLFCQSVCHLGRLTYPPNSSIPVCVKISNLSVKMSTWQTERERILALPLTEKRKLYKSKEYVKLNEIPTWQEYSRKETLAEPIPTKDDAAINISLNSTLSKKISIFRGDITTLEIDVIVNAANKTLRGGGGVDGAIHRAAGPLLLEECKSLGGCDTGHVKITGGYQLPAKFVFHTVGPQGEKPGFLRQCYRNSLQLLAEKKLRSIAFPCISTGIYGYPNMAAAHIAVYEIRKHLEQFKDVDRIIFCIFMEEDLTIYQGILQSYFPVS